MPDQLRKRILLVEDNPDDEILTLDALRFGSVISQIDVARDGAEALDYVYRRGQFQRRDDAPPDLILLDLKLPRRSGHEVLTELLVHDETRFTPVVVLTSSTEDEDILRSYLGGANSYIRKPVDFELFSAAVKSLGMYWLLYNQTPGQR